MSHQPDSKGVIAERGYMKKGTPKSLIGAIKNGIYDSPDQEIVLNTVKDHVKDFIAQKFTATMIKADPETELILKELFEKIVK